MITFNKGILLHVGLMKTGSTTMQRSLFPDHSQLIYLGRHYDRNSIKKGVFSEEIYEALRPVIWDVNCSLDVTETAKLCWGRIFPEGDGNKLVVGSWESLGDRPTIPYRRMLDRTRKIFGRCRVMYVLRNPETQIPSEYLELIKEKFLRRKREWMGPSASLSIDEWFARKLRKGAALSSSLNYPQNIQVSVELLGKENVGVFLFEDLQADSEAYYQAISGFLGIDEEETLALTKQKHFNPRLSQGQLDLIWKLDSSVLTRRMLSRLTPRWRHFLLRKISKSTGPAKVERSPELHEQIVNSTRDGHRWLVENFDLPLEKYGYPL